MYRCKMKILFVFIKIQGGFKEVRGLTIESARMMTCKYHRLQSLKMGSLNNEVWVVNESTE